MPKIKEIVQSCFGESKVRYLKNEDHAISIGAAIQAAMCVGLIEVEERKESESEDDNDFLAGDYLNEIHRESVDISKHKSAYKAKKSALSQSN